jgi:3-dehydroquinate synthase
MRLRTAGHVCRIHVADTLEALGPHLEVGEGTTVWVTDSTVVRQVWRRIRAMSSWGSERLDPLVVPAGESSKSIRGVERLYRQFLQRGLDRHSRVIAVGGGLVTDLAGFAAASWMRGIRWTAIPTTLLGMVDASIGGKTALNLGRTKNVIGAFHQPEAVLMATQLLGTLPRRERRSGLGEVAKTAMIADAAFFRWLEVQGKALLQAEAARDRVLVSRCARLKARVVEEDERESGRRAMLNFGHSIGHVLEAGSGYRLAHGEAVGLGMLAACRIAELTGEADEKPRKRLELLLRQWGMPHRVSSALSWKRVWTALGRDKKSLHGTPRFVLTPRIGTVVTGCAVEPEVVRDALRVLEPRGPVQ